MSWACVVDLSNHVLEVLPGMFPGHLDGGSHIVGENDKLRRSSVIKGAEAYDVDFGYNAAQIVSFFPAARAVFVETLTF
jgi:hypothetical protein